MKLKRVKGGGGKKWKQGDSCVSNPGNRKFRDAAKGNFFHKIGGESSLTVEALAEHTAALEVGSKLCADLEDDKSVGKSFNTFATNFTTCTIPAFDKFFKSFTVDSELQTRMLAIHAAAQEYIQDANLAESSTSYMCALMASLEGVQESEEDVAATLSLLAKVIRKVSKEVLKAKFGEYSKLFDDIFTYFSSTSNVKILINIIGCLSVLLRAQDEIQWTYPYTMNLFQKIITFTTHENGDIRATAQYNAGAILKGSSFMLPPDTPPQSSTEEEDEGMEEGDEEEEEEEKSGGAKAKVEFRAHPAALASGKFVLANLKMASQSMNGKATLYLLIFLQQIVGCLPQKILEQCCSRVLSVMHIGDSIVNNRSLKVFNSLFTSTSSSYTSTSPSNHTSTSSSNFSTSSSNFSTSSTYTSTSTSTTSNYSTALTLETNEALVNVLTLCATEGGSANPKALKLVPGMNSAELCVTWMETVANGILHLSKLDETLAIERFSFWTSQLTSFWKSDYEVVREKVWHTIDYLFDEMVRPLSRERLSLHLDSLLSAFKDVQKGLSFQYETAWPYVFNSLSPFFWVLGPHIPSELVPCLKNLSTMMDAPSPKGRRPLENAIGAAINGMGPAEVMKVVPLQITGDIKADEGYFWVLPLLRSHVKNTRLSFFEKYFVHLASKCFTLLNSLKERGKFDTLSGKTYQMIERQIWALLPSFAKGATDLDEALSIEGFAPMICEHIKTREDTRVDMMAALRHMVANSTRSSKLSFYGRNYLPAMFNLYLMTPRDKVPAGKKDGTIEDGQRLAAFTTIQEYLRIIPPARVLEFFNKILERYEQETDNLLRRKALLSLARSFLPHLDVDSLDTIYLKVKKDVEARESFVQKIAYRIIEDILTSDSAACHQFVQDRIQDIFLLLCNSPAASAASTSAYPSIAPNAVGARLKCLSLVLAHLSAESPAEGTSAFLQKVVQEAVSACGRGGSVRTRKAAFALLSEVGKTVQDTLGFSHEDTFQYCFELLPPLLPPSTHTANTILAIMALSYQYKDIMPASTLQLTVEDISTLLSIDTEVSNENRSITDSALSLLRMVFAVYPAPIMSDFVDIVVDNLVGLSAERRKKYRVKLRDILAALVRKFGADRVKGLIPEDDLIHKMVTNVVKKDNRRRRAKREGGRERGGGEGGEEEEEDEEAPTTLEKILLEIDREIEDDTKPSVKERKLKTMKEAKKKNKRETWIKEHEDEIVDLLDMKSSGQNITNKKPKSVNLNQDKVNLNPETDEEKYGFRIDKKTNKFVITEEQNEKNEPRLGEVDEDHITYEDIPTISAKESKKERGNTAAKRKRTFSEDSNTSNQQAVKYGAMRGGSERRKMKMKTKFDYGSEFKSKKAGGDVAKKGGVLPYAYVQFSKDTLNRRKKAKYAGQFKSLVKGARKGAAIGKKMKASRK